MTPHSCPSAERWKAHLDGSLSQTEQTVLTSHLDGCPACQKTLETLAAGGDSLLEIARRVGEPLAHTEGKITPEAGSATTAETMHESSQRMDEGLDFLAPSTKTGSIGRLGHYEVQEVIGQGGFGVVLKAFDEKLHRVVAIKVLSPSVASSGTARQRFTREARAAAAVTHEHVVTIHAVEDDANPPYLVMQLVSGMSLQDKLDKQGPLGLKEILRIGLQTACGLAAAHKQGLVHRDIKPANILLENGVERVKITDFGLARAVDDASLTQSGVVAGTPMFMAPEQAEGLNVDARADLFSLGSVLYLMCTGRPPFRATTTLAVLKRVVEDVPRPIREINPEIPEWLCDIVTKLHAKKPEDRYQSATEVADVLEERLAELQFTGRAGGVSPLSGSQAQGANAPRSLRKRWVAAGLVISVLAALLAFHFWPRDEWQPSPPDERPLVVTKDDKEGWIQLFNGKDLTGWTSAKIPADWKVEQGILTAQGMRSIFFTDRIFTNFHLKVRVKHDDKVSGSLAFRRRDELANSHAYYVNFRQGQTVTTGSIYSIASKKFLFSHDKAAPDDWFTLEVIANGSQIVVNLDDKKIAEITDREAGTNQAGFVGLTTDEKGSLQFSRIEIKELPLTPPADTQPFVVLAKANRTETRHPTLAAGVAAAQSGDTIEVRGNGPFVTEPFTIGMGKPLTIRAADGYRPVLQHKSLEEKVAWYAFLSTQSPLVLEGLSLEIERHPKSWHPICTSTQPLRISHCRMTFKGTGHCIHSYSPTLEVHRSELISENGAGISLPASAAKTVLVEECVLVGYPSLLLENMGKDRLPQGRLVLRRNSFVSHGNSAVIEARFVVPLEEWQKQANSAVNPGLRIEAENNLFDVYGPLFRDNRELLRVLYTKEAIAQPKETLALFPSMLAWEGQGNGFGLSGGFLGFHADLKSLPSPSPIAMLADWRKFWGGKEKDSTQGEIQFEEPMLEKWLVRKNVQTEILHASSFRLAKGSPGQGVLPGGKDLGADVDLVGPGEAYEKWQKTPAYQEWRKKTEELMQSP